MNSTVLLTYVVKMKRGKPQYAFIFNSQMEHFSFVCFSTGFSSICSQQHLVQEHFRLAFLKFICTAVKPRRKVIKKQ